MPPLLLPARERSLLFAPPPHTPVAPLPEKQQCGVQGLARSGGRDTVLQGVRGWAATWNMADARASGVLCRFSPFRDSLAIASADGQIRIVDTGALC